MPGWDFVGNDADPADDHGHGTAVAGVIGARSNNRVGVAGICWRCLVMPIKVLDSKGNGDDTLIAAGIVWAIDHGARVLNLSLGGPGSSVELGNALTYAASKGVVVVAAAGNAGGTTQFFPAADPHAVSVAATTVADQRYSWSNFGSWVRLAAPGCNVAPILGGGYGNFCGTSSAAPVVAGLVALELSAQPAATAQEAEDALARAAFPLPAFVQYGRIDAGKTLALLGSSAPCRSQGVATTGTEALRQSLERVIRRKCCAERRSTRMMSTKEGAMRSRHVVVIVAVVALTLGTAQTALADNNATGSVGAVQTGPVGVTPTAGASQSGATAAASVPVRIGGSGNNTATNSTGAVQAGGGNTSNNSTGTAQVSSVHASPSASAGASGNNASASVPADGRR